ncbi:hypothetical protein J6X90_01765 [Candidatus Saccharibacteria bacterium]|nr:hypothetical protein [Candidatus Saccharibacteria bacterium]
MKPREFRVDLKTDGYYMEVDTKKDNCKHEPAHWHLCKDGRKVGKISVPGCVWSELPSDCTGDVINEAKEVTVNNLEEIESVYKYNSLNGAA